MQVAKHCIVKYSLGGYTSSIWPAVSFRSWAIYPEFCLNNSLLKVMNSKGEFERELDEAILKV